MRSKTLALLGTAALGSALALGGTLIGTASASQGDAATGGGQILVGSKGAGDTIAFTAKGSADSGTGQVQYVDRSDGTGQAQTVQHGTVTCIDVNGNVAKIAGVWRDGSTFGLYVVDNGEGQAAEDDVVTILPGEATCDFNDPDQTTGLARGNAQVRDGGM